MKIYGLATTAYSHGHGDSYDYSVITPMGSYGSDGWPPFFSSREAAEKFAKTVDYPNYKIVEVELRNE